MNIIIPRLAGALAWRGIFSGVASQWQPYAGSGARRLGDDASRGPGLTPRPEDYHPEVDLSRA